MEGSVAEAPRAPGGRKPGTFTSETAREARKLRGSRLQPKDLAPADAAIETALRRRALDDPRAAEILLRWLQRPSTEPPQAGHIELDTMPSEELKALHTRLLRLAQLSDDELQRALQAVPS
jgi:hypothetical protein